jgi:hypothetical protein
MLCMKASKGLILMAALLSHAVFAQECVKGDIQYSVATYADEIFIKNKYGHFLDSLLIEPVTKYFCETEILHLQVKDNYKRKRRHSPSKAHVIEPLFINLSTFNGIYAKRIWSVEPGALNPKYKCGYTHYVFIVANNKYIDLTRDSVSNEDKIKAHLGTDFSTVEISRMITYYKHGDLCNSFTFYPPFYIKRDDEVLFDVDKIRKEN